MQLTFLHGYPDYVGKRLIFAGYGSGPASYLATGDPVVLPRYGNYIDIIFSALSVSGNYQVTAQPSSFGARATWSLLWSGIAGGVASVTAAAAGVGTGMTPGTYIINATGGTGGTGGQIQVVVTSAAQVGAITVLSGGKGYTVAQTWHSAGRLQLLPQY